MFALSTKLTFGQARNPLDNDPHAWIAEAAKNEQSMLLHPDSYIRYHTHVQEAKGDFVRDVIETKEGTVARTIMKDGRPLTPEEDGAERERLQAMIDDPQAYARHERRELAGRQRAEEIIHLMPDAMLWTYTPDQPQIAGLSHGKQVVLDFAPDPKFKPPSLETEALSGINGRIWIEIESQRIVHLEAHVFQPVSIGFGMLARVYPGGNLILDQVHVDGTRWIYKHFTERVNVRALMLKQLNVHSEVESADFQPLPAGSSYQDAVRTLLNTPLSQKNSFSSSK